MALIGIMLTSTAAPAPVESYSALTGSRRPFSSTSTFVSDRPRRRIVAVPEPDGEFDAISPWS